MVGRRESAMMLGFAVAVATPLSSDISLEYGISGGGVTSGIRGNKKWSAMFACGTEVGVQDVF